MCCVMHTRGPCRIFIHKNNRRTLKKYVGHDGRGRYSSEDRLKRTKEGFPIWT
jgi:hypothetical protein